MSLERRITGSSFLLRSSGTAHTLVGHAAVFNRDSELIQGGFIERIAPGAFRESIANRDDVRALINHDANLILGRTTSGTLTLEEDDVGLLVRITPPKTSYALDLLESTRRGDISQMSFGFETIQDRWERGNHGRPDIRTLLKVKLFDVSPVTYPAYPDTDVAVRRHEKFLRNSGSAHGSWHGELDLHRRRWRNEGIDLLPSGRGPGLEGRLRRQQLEEQDLGLAQVRFCRLELGRALWQPSNSHRSRQWFYEYLNTQLGGG